MGFGNAEEGCTGLCRLVCDIRHCGLEGGTVPAKAPCPAEWNVFKAGCGNAEEVVRFVVDCRVTRGIVDLMVAGPAKVAAPAP